jgi:S-adenosylmethionine hydrolase
MKQLITITTDFKDNFAAGQLRAVVASMGYEDQLIENHDVEAFSITEGAYGIWQLAKYCPQDTIHVGVIDPGVGSDRDGVIIQTENFWFVGPNNGLLWPAANTDGVKTVWKIDESYFGNVSNSFHGRDVFIKASVHVAQGKRPEDFGCSLYNQLEKLEFENNQILHIDHYGNIKYWGQNTFGLPKVKTFSDVEIGQPLIIDGSSDLQELAINQGSAKDKFGLKLGQVIHRL